jgi:hypothetical protein
MASEPNFTGPEWGLLRDLPYEVILAAIVTEGERKGWQVAKETAVAAQQLVADAKDALDNPIILRVVTEMSQGGTDSGNREVDLTDERARSSAIESALAASAAAAALLTRVPPDQAQTYKQWVFNAAVAASRATKSGGVLGIGDQEITDDEHEFLDRLDASLGLNDA